MGRRTEYTVDADKPLRHPAEIGLTVRDLLRFSACLAQEDMETEAAQ